MSSGSAHDGEIRVAFMHKRSQNRRAMTKTNYKTRWFALTPNQLIYYDGTDDVSITCTIIVQMLNSAFGSYIVVLIPHSFSMV